MKKFAFILSFILLIGVLAACGSKDTASGSDKKENQLSEEKLVIGVTAGPHEQVVEKVKEVAAKDGLEIELKVFSDYVMPNTALEEGELDMNSYQHKPFMDQFNKDKSTHLSAVGKTILNPMAIYSNEFKSLEDLPNGAKVGLPNDPTNGTRSLYLFEAAGLIKIKEDKRETATIHDLEENPKEIEFVELEAAQIPKQLPELDAAAINTNFAIDAGLSPKEDGIFLEPIESPYVNWLVVRDENKNDPAVKKVLKAFHTDEVKAFIDEEFKGSILPGWE
ncbi:metal ABC transporter substrate-binding protein [Bacillus sp. M6-12]|uniref:MetQ/NlpA family ABC transporter substrate-binding protein n=1 Tax=Bacillus sp. M6-12 TaxID=2054166 RepID=UPI000C7880FB|nr:MetQ/NlpA family ABC transporter substrate-binding protein [Bacillus sp. M6-12]PLS18470.1 metal ABC transporter substrate-binding protein [Bacillus sp. M6-12]